MKKRVLVTGGLGYVGGRLCEVLLQSGYDVLIGTRNTQQTLPASVKNARLLSLNLGDEDALKSHCGEVDSVIHLSAVNEIEALADPVKAFDINVLGTLRLVRAASSVGVSRFVFLSTAHIYGPLVGTITENTLPRPTHPYATSHRAAEDVVLAENSEKFTSVVVRLSNSFGAPIRSEVDRWTLVANDLCKQAVVNHSLVLKSSGLQERDFITLKDTANALQHLLELPVSHLGDRIFNLGGENTMTVLAMAQLVAERYRALYDRSIELTTLSQTPAQSTVRLNYSVDKLKATGFRWTQGLEEEIDATLKLCKDSFGSAR